MKGLNVFISIFLTSLTILCVLVLVYSYSNFNQILNGFSNNLDQKGFWLNPANSNISVLKEEDVYTGTITYPTQSSNDKIILGISQPSLGFFQITVGNKYQKDSIYTVKTVDETTGEVESNLATRDDFLNALKDISNGNTNQKMDICVVKDISASGTNYDYFCGIFMYEN